MDTVSHPKAEIMVIRDLLPKAKVGTMDTVSHPKAVIMDIRGLLLKVGKVKALLLSKADTTGRVNLLRRADPVENVTQNALLLKSPFFRTASPISVLSVKLLALSLR